ncbi:prephenate dehydrogenase [Paucilactobacillus hokkaidonensis JCM 18461]|uniref:Prephenate dehydrogenase n=2 Tax=Paucilactobacillus hokkaidonensis TaxID=1193095 RepID=A0A0A1H1B3_9LACO|nr:prephenate dehydrogenase/arogenate dehydrogenase family protein [Paucilactobacillus hokkaidonensis]KRO11120.1 prephenate dehydrogenase [Paucilactobacillus hokkaidonensis]BAP86516.1 prephenate dehydrogenase [Paucilactobacillus hokkaidonensis JCM 18461]
MKFVVVGLGEMGASLALTMKNKLANTEVVGVDRDEESLRLALENGIVDTTTTNLQTAVADADVIVLATPTKVIINYLHQLVKLPLKNDVIVTDTGSTKVQVMDAAQSLIKRGICFVGGHAMAGTQKAGVMAADKTLYESSPYFLISNQPTAVQKVKEILQPLQAKFTEISAVEHDQMMAQLSDLPHVVAAALVNSSEDMLEQEPELPHYAAGGFKDTTRIGGADPQMWTDVLLTNRPATLAALKNYQVQIQTMINNLENGDEAGIKAFFTASKATRAKF